MGFNSASPLLTESVSNVTATNSVELGTRKCVDSRDYVYVYNAGGSDINPTYGVTVSGGTGYSVTVSSVTSNSPLVGVVRNATLTTGTYGWAVVRGATNIEVNADTSLGTGTAEQCAVLGDDGVFSRVTGATGYIANALGGAYALAVTASGGSVLARINGIG